VQAGESSGALYALAKVVASGEYKSDIEEFGKLPLEKVKSVQKIISLLKSDNSETQETKGRRAVGRPKRRSSRPERKELKQCARNAPIKLRQKRPGIQKASIFLFGGYCREEKLTAL
jgi:hypothetical protein